MSKKKKIKNQYAESIFSNPDNIPWGGNIWGKKFTIFAIAFLSITFALVFYADSKGLIDWQETGDPMEMENSHPYFKKDQAADTVKVK